MTLYNTPLTRRGAVCLFALMVWAWPVRADKVTLTNGDSLTGRVLAVQGGKMEFQSQLLGSLTIEMAHIQTFQTDANTPILTKQAQQPVQARVGADEKGLWLDDGTTKQLVRLEDIDKLGTAARPRSPEGWKWSGNVEVGFSGRSGNTDRAALFSKLRIEGKDQFTRLVGYLSSLYAEQEVDGEQVRSDDEIKAGGRIQRIFIDGLSGYLAGDLERDRVKDLQFRSLVTAGLGKRWIEDKKWFYETRFGIGCEYEKFEDGSKEHKTVGSIVSDLNYKVNEHIDISQETSWLPNLDDTRSYRILAESAVTIYLDSDHHFFIKSGLKNEYDSQPAEDAERLDNYYFTNVGYKF